MLESADYLEGERVIVRWWEEVCRATGASVALLPSSRGWVWSLEDELLGVEMRGLGRVSGEEACIAEFSRYLGILRTGWEMRVLDEGIYGGSVRRRIYVGEYRRYEDAD